MFSCQDTGTSAFVQQAMRITLSIRWRRSFNAAAGTARSIDGARTCLTYD